MLGFGGNLTAHGVASYFANSLDKVLLGRFCGAHALGLYSNAYALMSKSLMVSGYTVGEVAIPAMSRTHDNSRGMRDVYRRMLQFTVVIGLPICLISVAWAHEVIHVLLGPKWMEAAPLLQLLFLGLLPRMIMSSTGWVYIATGQPGRMLCWQLLWSPALAIGFIIGLPWGAVGVAAAFAIACWLGVVPAMAYCFRGTAFGRQDVLAPVIRPVLCGLFAWAGATGLSWLLGSSHPNQALHLIAHVLVFGLLYGLATAWTVPLVRSGIKKLLRRQHDAPTVPSSVG